jgi:hypothetical protein
LGLELAWAAKVENSCCKRFSPQEGHASSGVSGVWRISFSNFVPQS